jgi:hypothetical protein
MWPAGIINRIVPEKRIRCYGTMDMRGDRMDSAIDSREMEADVPPSLTTTLYELMTALQAGVAADEDALVVALVARWLRTGRIRWLGNAASHRSW